MQEPGQKSPSLPPTSPADGAAQPSSGQAPPRLNDAEASTQGLHGALAAGFVLCAVVRGSVSSEHVQYVLACMEFAAVPES